MEADCRECDRCLKAYRSCRSHRETVLGQSPSLPSYLTQKKVSLAPLKGYCWETALYGCDTCQEVWPQKTPRVKRASFSSLDFSPQGKKAFLWKSQAMLGQAKNLRIDLDILRQPGG